MHLFKSIITKGDGKDETENSKKRLNEDSDGDGIEAEIDTWEWKRLYFYFFLESAHQNKLSFSCESDFNLKPTKPVFSVRK